MFNWHFNKAAGLYHAPPPVSPLSIFTEGHTCVALFMVLSGYMFAKLLDGKTLNYFGFLCNRLLRLAPVLLLLIVIVGLLQYMDGKDIMGYIKPAL